MESKAIFGKPINDSKFAHDREALKSVTVPRHHSPLGYSPSRSAVCRPDRCYSFRDDKAFFGCTQKLLKNLQIKYEIFISRIKLSAQAELLKKKK